MGRTAVFVDAGYLFAQGSTALAGRHVRRENLELNIPSVVSELTQFAEQQSVGAQLLRIYWYDGVSAHRGPTSEQLRVASTNNVKLRLGFLNSQGQQKGVDSLIVMDLVDLGRNQAISDAVLLSGDEDVRIGVQIAQNFGVRVHLLGISPSRGSQSRQLIQEADTSSEWDRDTVNRFLSIRPQAQTAMAVPVRPAAGVAVPALQVPAEDPTPSPIISTPNPTIEPGAESADVVNKLAAFALQNADALTSTQLTSCELYWKTERGVPPEFDRVLLREGSMVARSMLVPDQIKVLRRTFSERVKARLANPAGVLIEAGTLLEVVAPEARPEHEEPASAAALPSDESRAAGDDTPF